MKLVSHICNYAFVMMKLQFSILNFNNRLDNKALYIYNNNTLQ